MPRHTVSRAIGLLLLLGASRPVAAQGVEVSFGSGLSLPVHDYTYASQYVPPFPFVEHTGVAFQTVTLDPSASPIIWGAVSWLSNGRAGLEVRIDWRRTPLGGVNTPYDVSLQYTASQPPDFVPRQFSFDRTYEWPDTDGHLQQFTATGAFVVHAGRPDGAGVRLSAGGGITTVSGEFEPLGYTAFRLGGHSVLIADELQVAMTLDSETTIGLSLGAEAHAPLGEHAAFVGGVRIFVPRTMDVSVHAQGLVNPEEALRDVPLSEIQDALAPTPLHIRPVTFDLTAGLSVRF